MCKSEARCGGEWSTPFTKQCLVTTGVSLNMMAHGLVLGFASVLLPQLKRPHSLIPIDDVAGSWIASVVGFALLVGAFLAPSIMSKYGRRIANLVSVVPLLVGWFCIITATGIPALMVARCLQGVAMGMSATLSPISIGEYTSPSNRGAFLTTISLAIASGVLTVHTLGSFLSWQRTALVCALIAFFDFLVIFHSPETPSWLANKGRYDECRDVFRWLRGYTEEEELDRLIEVNILDECSRIDDEHLLFFKKVKRSLVNVNTTIRKREFYKPLIIMIHLYFLNQWSGANVLAAYTTDIFHRVVGDDVNVALLIITMGIQRLISNTCAIYVIKKVKRRKMLLVTVGINISAFLSIALYEYARGRGLLPSAAAHPAVGVFLIHMHMFSIATGTVPLPNILAGEIFPLEYRSVGGGISVLFLSTNLFITIKTAPFLFEVIGLHGAYCLYAAVVGYCLLVAWLMLPETKDRTLQEIEDEFRGRPLSAEEMNTTLSLTSLRLQNFDRRCSSPAIF